MRIAFLACLLSVLSASSIAAPMPPCGQEPEPPYGKSGGAPFAAVWTSEQLRAAHWQPAACLGWRGDSKLVAAVASRFQADHDVFERLGSVTEWPSVQYWSISKQRWRPLALAVRMVNETGQPASASALVPTPGHDVFFVERDENGGDVTYRLRFLERTAHRIVLAMENVTPVKIALVTVFEPGSLQTVTFVEKEQANSWTTYQISRVGSGGSSLALGRTGSFLNRLDAVRRYLAGQPSDQPPPIASR